MPENRVFVISIQFVMLLAILGYGIALESPVHLGLGVLLILLNTWYRGFRPQFGMPRFVASTLAVLTGLWSVAGLFGGMMSPLLAVSQWLYFLLLISLYSPPSNRSYAQLLVMSLVLMVAGAINSANLFFGLILFAYLILSLYCCLLFHIKVEAERAATSRRVPTDQESVTRSLHDRPGFARSVRRLTAVISIFSISMGVIVFLFFPRSAAPSIILRFNPDRASSLTGFSEHISLNQVAKITQSAEVVAHLSITQNNKPIRYPDLYVRGVTLDIYTGDAPDLAGQRFQWLRSTDAWRSARLTNVAAGAFGDIAAPASDAPDRIHQQFLLNATGTPTLFALSGPISIRADRDMAIQYFGSDGSLRGQDVGKGAIQYEVVSTGQAPPPIREEELAELPDVPREFQLPPDLRVRASRIDPRIAEFAARADVSGSDDHGPLAPQRGKSPGPTPLDIQIARNVERYLQSNYQYTLDLTDTSRKRDQDPITSFLYDFRRGHCEYFAGAMTLMCQSLGLQARVVVGFRVGASDYNTLGNYYLIRQSHAHAWVEVLTPEGWKTFDPTSGNVYYAQRPAGGMFRSVSDFFDYLQYKWAASVVTYSDENRASVWQRVESGVQNSFSFGGDFLQRIRDFFRPDSLYLLSSRLLVGAIAVAIAILLGAVGLYLMERRKLYRRAERIGLGALPTHQQLRLARQLAFYDDLIRMLARQRILRPSNLTPREFARSLSFLPADAYQEVSKLTDIYYRVRYGNQHLRPNQRRRLSASITRMSSTLSSRSSRIPSQTP